MGLMERLAGRYTYFDVNVLIYALEGSSSYQQELQFVLAEVDGGVFRAATSELSLAEILVKPIRRQDRDQLTLYRQFLTTRMSFLVAPVSRSILLRAAELRAHSPLKLPDAIHVATALEVRCEVLLTNDRRIPPVSGLDVLTLSEVTGL